MVLLEKLKWSTQALAAPFEIQLSLFPDLVVVADELALDWEEWFCGNKDELKTMLTSEQFAALSELDLALVKISGKEEFWTDEALRNVPEWIRIRELARICLAKCGWPQEIPLRERGHIYRGVNGKVRE